jgi:hypothetical protein
MAIGAWTLGLAIYWIEYSCSIGSSIPSTLAAASLYWLLNKLQKNRKELSIFFTFHDQFGEVEIKDENSS